MLLRQGHGAVAAANHLIHVVRIQEGTGWGCLCSKILLGEDALPPIPQDKRHANAVKLRCRTPLRLACIAGAFTWCLPQKGIKMPPTEAKILHANCIRVVEALSPSMERH